MNCTTQRTALFLFKRRHDHKQAQYHPQEYAIIFPPPGTSTWQPKTCPLARPCAVSLLYCILCKVSSHWKSTRAQVCLSLKNGRHINGCSGDLPSSGVHNKPKGPLSNTTQNKKVRGPNHAECSNKLQRGPGLTNAVKR